MNARRNFMRRALIALPAVICLVWFLAERIPDWFSPPPPWERYAALAALPGGCQAALALATTGSSPASGGSMASDEAGMLIEQAASDYLGSPADVATGPELMRLNDGTLAWSALAEIEDDARLKRGALVLLGDAERTVHSVIYLTGIEASPRADCDAFGPQPRGLRAQLRPYLPLAVFAAYGLAVVGGLMVTGYLRGRSKI